MSSLSIQATLSRLVAFQTVSNDRRENTRALRWIAQSVQSLPLQVKWFKNNGVSSLFLTTKKTQHPRVLLQAHLDVVDAPPALFKLRKRGGRMYGRGVFDMKFAVACYLKLLHEFSAELAKYDFGILLSTDEELGGFNGVGAILDQGVSCEVCVLPDGGENWTLQKSGKGVWQFVLESQGISGHSARPWSGRNALEILLDALQEIRNQFPKEPCGSQRHLHDTFSLTILEGGHSINKIPHFARGIIDIRFQNMDPRDRVRTALRNRVGNSQLHMKEIASASSYTIGHNNKYVRLFRKLALEEFDIVMPLVNSPGSSDARFFAAKHVPIIVTRPHGGGHHSDEEWINLHSLQRFYAVLKNFVHHVARN